MSASIVSDRTIGLVAGFAADQPDVLPPGWTAHELSRRLRVLNEVMFRRRYPRAPFEREWSECPAPVSAASLPQVFRALQELAYNADPAADPEAARLLPVILARAVKLLPQDAIGSIGHGEAGQA